MAPRPASRLRLRIATVVVPAADAERLAFLRPRYAAVHAVAGFVVFERRDRPWPRLERITHRRYRVLVPSTGGVWVPTGIAAYPLWHAKSGHGPLETRTDPWGLLELRGEEPAHAHAEVGERDERSRKRRCP